MDKRLGDLRRRSSSENAGAQDGRLEALTRGVVALVVAALSFAVVLTPDVAAAAGTCGTKGVGQTWQTGFYHDPVSFPGNPSYEGASGYIVVRDGDVCTGPNAFNANFLNAWLMITGQGNTWAQVGFERNAGQTLTWFAQDVQDPNHDNILQPGEIATWYYQCCSIVNQVGVRHTFQVLYNSPCGCIKMIIDGIAAQSTTYNPYAYSSGWGSFSAWLPTFAAEAGFPQSDVPGTSGGKTAFTALGAQLVSNDQLVPMSCSMNFVNENPSRWGLSASSCDAINIWTSAP